MPPRRTKAAKKDTEVSEDKSEGGSRRKSGRAVSKPETPTKEASRSRRGTTVAQTVVSVSDSKTPRARSSRRDSSSPPPPASRTKAARRSTTSQVSYQESDDELENAKKVDENFSGEEFEESDSDESSKPKKKGKAAKSPAKGRGKGKGKAKKASPKKGGRRGRPTKKKTADSDEDEEEEMVELSDGEVEVVAKKTTKTPPPQKTSSRGRKIKVVDLDEADEEPKSSRRSSRGARGESSSKKRPARSVKAKKYAEEEEEEEVEEIGEDKEDGTPRKRKRESSPEEASKRLKEDKEEEVKGDPFDALLPPEKRKETEVETKEEEAMEVDETEASETKTWNVGDEGGDKKEEGADKAGAEDSEMKESSVPEEQESVESKSEGSKSSEIVEEHKDQEQKAEGLEPKVPAATIEEPKSESIVEKSAETPKEKTPEKLEVSHPASENVSAPVVPDQKPKEVVSQVDSVPDPPNQQDDASKYDSSTSDESKLTIDETQPSTSPPATAVHQPKETSQTTVLNGSEKNDAPPSSGHDIHNSEHTEKSTPTENGAHEEAQHNNSVSPADQYFSLTGRKYIVNAKLSDSVRQSVKDKTFGFVSYNLGTSNSDAYMQKEKLLHELNSLDARIICLQQVAKPFFNSVLEPSLDALGFKSMYYLPADSLRGIATFYKTSLFRPTKKTEISLKQLVEKELESSSLGPEDRAAVKSHIKRCGNVLFIQFDTVIGSQSLTVANVQIPPTDLSMHALQVSCLAREVVKINGGTNVPLLLGGEFNLSENDASYQLLRDGYLSNDMIEELQRRKDIALPGKENESLVNLLWNLFQHMSSNLNSCYKSVLDHEFFIPETKKTSPDLLWFSSNSLQIVGVLDAVADKPLDHNFSLKADVAFSV